ncbi:MAG: 2-hydroxyglutaryl-CoA dehydratase [Epulopiscium sp.]|nr:2-hydroxyglutaryl-CoA dehydratase [Candidatus Epulonipiscium sp.]
MKITFPHMGNIHIAVKVFFDAMGVDYVIPPMNNGQALEIGAIYSPEEMCLPYKIMIGNYMQAIEQGANTVVIVGSCGPCRFGEYCELQINLLKKLGHEVKFIVLDNPKEIGKEEVFKRIGLLVQGSKKNKYENVKAALKGIKAMNLLDEIEKKAYWFAGYEGNKGECKKILYRCRQEVVSTEDSDQALKILTKYKKAIHNVKLDYSKEPLKVAIIGEIYTVIEPFSNQYIEERLMDYGVSSIRTLTPSWWVKDMALKAVHLNSIKLRRASKEYLALGIGGHATECIGEAVLATKAKYDGAIQIFPVGCMPEIVSKAILPTISKEKNFPIMTLVMDEMTGEGGYATRVEAFLDLLERRKERCII